MPVRRDPRTGRPFFRAVVKLPDGSRQRIYGVPGVPGPYADLGANREGAKEAERRAIAELMTGKPARAAAPAKKEVPTIQSYSETFLVSYVPTLTKPSARKSLQRDIASIVNAFGALRLDEIRQIDVDTFVGAEKRRKMAVKTINNRLSGLSSLIKYAVTNGVIPPPSPPLQCKIDGQVGEVEAVPMEHVERLLESATDDRYRVAVLLGAEAGLRAGEILGLQWGDLRDRQLTVRRAIDKDTREVVAPKHNKVRTVPLSPRLEAALESLPRLGLWVVSRQDGDLLSYWALLEAIGALYDRAGVPRPEMPIHGLRHTFGTVMAGQGVPLPTLKELMGHSEIVTTMRYVSVNEQQKRDAIAAVWGDRPAWQPRGSKEAPKARKPRKV